MARAKTADVPPGVAVTEMGRMEMVPVDDLKIDHAYQRDLDHDLVQKIADNWEAMAAGPIVVSRRADGSLYIVNGQHRAAAAKTLGHPEMLAQVVEGLNRAQEAELRLKGNTRRGDKSLERFKAQVAAGHKESLEIQQICRNFETQINPWPNVYVGINAVSAVEFLYRKDKGVLLTRTFEVIQETWKEVGGEYAGSGVMKAIAWTLSKHEGELDRQRLIERLRVTGLDALKARAAATKAAMGGSGWINLYRAMVEAYNDKLGQAARLEWRTGSWSTASKRRGEANPDDFSGGG